MAPPVRFSAFSPAVFHFPFSLVFASPGSTASPRAARSRFLPMYFLTIRGGTPIAEDRTMSGATERTGSFASLPDWPLLIPYP